MWIMHILQQINARLKTKSEVELNQSPLSGFDWRNIFYKQKGKI